MFSVLSIITSKGLHLVQLATDILKNNYEDRVKCWSRKTPMGAEVGEPHCPTGAPQGQGAKPYPSFIAVL